MAGCETALLLFTYLSLFTASSVEDRACSYSQPLFPTHCREFARLFVRKLASLLCVLRHPGNFTSQVEKRQSCRSVYIYQFLFFVQDWCCWMRQKPSMTNAQFTQEMSFSPNFMATCVLCLKVAIIPDLYLINLCITHNIKNTYSPLSLVFLENSSYPISPSLHKFSKTCLRALIFKYITHLPNGNFY